MIKTKDFIKLSTLVFLSLILINVLGSYVWDYFGFKIAPIKDAEAKINDLGFREELNSNELKKLNVPIIAFVGNSVVGGFHYELDQTFAKQTANQIEKQHNKKIYGLNFAFDGYEIYREFDSFKAKTEGFPIRYVVWVPGISDRVNRDFVQKKVRETEEQKSIHSTRNQNPQDRLLTGFYKRLAQYIYIERDILQLKFVSSEHNQYYSNGMINSISDESRGEMKSTIRDFNSYLKSRGIKLYVLFLPPLAFRMNKSWKDASFFRIIAETLDEEKIPYLQLVDYFHEHKDEDVFFDYVHLNQSGHWLVANKLSEFLAPDIEN